MRRLPLSARLIGVMSWIASGLAAQPGPPAGGAVKVFILAGQSNLAGRAPESGLTAGYLAGAASVRLDYVCSFGAKSTGAGAPDPHRSEGWVPLRPSPKHTSTPERHFGPEMGFGRTLAARWPDRRIAIIKHGRGATNLAEDWNPDATAGRQHYREFIAQVRAALESLGKEGLTVELGAFVWCQGEADSTRREWAEAYGENLAALFTRVRADLLSPGLPALVVLTGDGRQDASMTFAGIVRDSQRAVTSRDPRAALVAGDDFPLLDHVHYDAPSQLKLGERLAEVYLDRFQQPGTSK